VCRTREKDEHCRRLASSSSDEKTTERIKALIQELQAERAALHSHSEQHR
jgi:hypothetical protein